MYQLRCTSIPRAALEFLPPEVPNCSANVRAENAPPSDTAGDSECHSPSWRRGHDAYLVTVCYHLDICAAPMLASSLSSSLNSLSIDA
jgi:hypothetical protein